MPPRVRVCPAANERTPVTTSMFVTLHLALLGRTETEERVSERINDSESARKPKATPVNVSQIGTVARMMSLLRSQ